MHAGQGWRGERVRVAERVHQLLSGTVFDDGRDTGHDAESVLAGLLDESDDDAAAPQSEPPPRWIPGRRSAVAMALAVLLTAGVAGWWYFASRPRPIAATMSTGAAATASRAGMTAGSAAIPAGPTATPPVSASPEVLVVDVAGKVRRPGIYRLPPGARVYQAVEAAGGALPGTDTTGINMAAPLTDGEQVIVGGPPGVGGTVLPAGPGGGLQGGAGHGVVSLNSATQEQLESLPGVGPVLAQKILDWRAAHGRFRSVDDLRQVSGIGEAKFAALRPRVSL